MREITVIVMTYNQIDYIRQTLDSILSQKIDVDFDILIHDDCSDDGTYQVLLDYQNKYFEKIRIIRHESRKFLIEGFNMMIFNHVVPYIDSKYVAYCDGDDYWCDSLKLKKQYDFMESHIDYTMCCHSAYQLKNNGDMSSSWYFGSDCDIDMSDIINDKPGIHIATSSIFLRSEIFKNFSEWRKSYPVEDVPLYMTAALFGKIYRISDIMCVYRQFAIGSWSTQNKNDVKRKIDHLSKLKKSIVLFDEQTNHQYRKLVSQNIESCDFRIAMLNSDFKDIFSNKNKRFLKRLPRKERLSLRLQYRLPCLYNLLHKKKD